MDVIPLTLAISLLLSLIFIAFFVREFSRPRRAGADRDSLLPLEQEMSTAPTHPHSRAHSPGHVDDDTCASKRTDGKCCASCQRRKDRAVAKSAASAPAAS
jgi:hypothetical protein